MLGFPNGFTTCAQRFPANIVFLQSAEEVSKLISDENHQQPEGMGLGRWGLGDVLALRKGLGLGLGLGLQALASNSGLVFVPRKASASASGFRPRDSNSGFRLWL